MALKLTSTDSKEYEALTDDDNPERFTPIELRAQNNEAGSHNLIRLLTGTTAVLCATVFSFELSPLVPAGASSLRKRCGNEVPSI